MIFGFFFLIKKAIFLLIFEVFLRGFGGEELFFEGKV